LFFYFYSNQSARNLSQFAESAMAVKRVILQQFSMQLSYMNANKTERANIYQPSLLDGEVDSAVSDDFSIPDMPKRTQQRQQTESSGSDDEHYEFKRDSESLDSQPATPSDHSSDEDNIQTILDNVLTTSSNSMNAMNSNIVYKKSCENSTCTKTVESQLQSRRGQRQLFIICPTPSG
jgi:hypothetical protein